MDGRTIRSEGTFEHRGPSGGEDVSQEGLPPEEEAAISQFSMWVDGEKLKGRVLDRDEARRVYADIVRTRRDPAILECVGRDAFQARVFPIPAHGEKRIELPGAPGSSPGCGPRARSAP